MRVCLVVCRETLLEDVDSTAGAVGGEVMFGSESALPGRRDEALYTSH